MWLSPNIVSLVKELNQEERGELLTALCRYMHNDGSVPAIEKAIVRVVFRAVLEFASEEE